MKTELQKLLLEIKESHKEYKTREYNSDNLEYTELIEDYEEPSEREYAAISSLYQALNQLSDILTGVFRQDERTWFYTEYMKPLYIIDSRDSYDKEQYPSYIHYIIKLNNDIWNTLYSYNREVKCPSGRTIEDIAGAFMDEVRFMHTAT